MAKNGFEGAGHFVHELAAASRMNGYSTNVECSHSCSASKQAYILQKMS